MYFHLARRTLALAKFRYFKTGLFEERFQSFPVIEIKMFFRFIKHPVISPDFRIRRPNIGSIYQQKPIILENSMNFIHVLYRFMKMFDNIYHGYRIKKTVFKLGFHFTQPAVENFDRKFTFDKLCRPGYYLDSE